MLSRRLKSGERVTREAEKALPRRWQLSSG